MIEKMTYKPLQMIAEDGDDLHVIAACLQDALIPLSGIEYDEKEGYFCLVANRFCWECESETLDGNDYYTRVAAGLSFRHVTDVHKKDINIHNQHELINLLTIHQQEDDFIHLIFSGGSEIKLKIDKLNCHLKDIDEPYPTSKRPSHK